MLQQALLLMDVLKADNDEAAVVKTAQEIWISLESLMHRVHSTHGNMLKGCSFTRIFYLYYFFRLCIVGGCANQGCVDRRFTESSLKHYQTKSSFVYSS